MPPPLLLPVCASKPCSGSPLFYINSEPWAMIWPVDYQSVGSWNQTIKNPLLCQFPCDVSKHMLPKDTFSEQQLHTCSYLHILAYACIACIEFCIYVHIQVIHTYTSKYGVFYMHVYFGFWSTHMHVYCDVCSTYMHVLHVYARMFLYGTLQVVSMYV